MISTRSRFIKMALSLFLYMVGTEYKGCSSDSSKVSATMAMDTIVVHAEDFGIKGDGMTDNSVSLKQMVNQYARSDKFVRIQFSKGEYLYSDNTWPTGLIYFRIEGNGSRFRNIQADGTQGEDCMALHMRGPHRRYDPTNRYTYNNGYKFKIKNANTIQQLGRRGKFRRGDLVVLSGYEQQHEGFPPNARYIEYHKVIGCKGKNIKLSGKIENPFDETWTDYAWGGLPGLELKSGAPRVMNLSRTDFPFPRVAQFRDLSFEPNPNCNISNSLVVVGEIVELQNVDLDILYPTYTRVFRYINGNIRQAVEFDKFVDSVYFENVSIHRDNNQPNRSSALAATSVNFLELKNCRIEGPLKVSPRNLFVNHSTFILGKRDNGLCAIESYGEWFPVYSVRVEAPEIITRGAREFCLIEYDFINAVKVTPAPDGSCLAIPDDEFNRSHALRSIAIGTLIRNKTDGTLGHVKKIQPNGAGDWCLIVDWDSPPHDVKEIEWSSTREITLRDIPEIPDGSYIFSNQRNREKSSLEVLQKLNIEEK